ncbi:hypothetical protein OAP63_11510 [Vibrio sp.]|nr:hypothetical protein [Vibrio sp.]
MRKTKRLSQPMYNLLIKQNLDSFTILQLRDAFLGVSDRFTDINEARKYVYRQVNNLVSHGYLLATGNGRKKRYTKTELFFDITFMEKAEKKTQYESIPKVTEKKMVSSPDTSLAILKKELNQFQGELSIALDEVDDCRSLMERFPDYVELLEPMLMTAQKRSSAMYARIGNRSTLIHSIENKVPKQC